MNLGRNSACVFVCRLCYRALQTYGLHQIRHKLAIILN